jgi:catechol 2,3-dioxygenase-like lactoylglutathione lyase family enzyme
MNVKINIVTLFVADYDASIRFFTEKFGFVLIEDIFMTTSRRWVKVAPSIESPVHVLLHIPLVKEEEALIGHQTASRPIITLSTYDISKDMDFLAKQDVKIHKPISEEVYGKRAQVLDLYGNIWELVEYDVFH